MDGPYSVIEGVIVFEAEGCEFSVGRVLRSAWEVTRIELVVSYRVAGFVGEVEAHGLGALTLVGSALLVVEFPCHRHRRHPSCLYQRSRQALYVREHLHTKKTSAYVRAR